MRIERDDTPPPRLGVIAGAITAGVAGAVLLGMSLGLPLPDCLFRAATGVPCPTCGSTRLLESLAAGDVAGAAAANPVVFAGLMIVTLWTALSLARRRLVATRAERSWGAVLALTGVAVGWGYAVWAGGGG